MKTIGLYLNSPLQTWAGAAVVKTRVDTQKQPSERALRGMLLATFGVPRGETLPVVEKASIEVKVINQGHIVKDFQIIGNRSDEMEFLTRIGKLLRLSKVPARPIRANNSSSLKSNEGNSIVRRTYLADAKFLVLISGETDEDTESIYNSLLDPVWTPYLGKRAFPPTFPFILGVFDSENPEDEATAKIREIEGCVV